ncbi:MAG: lasso peptide biosynthesis PqqD family chaperone [Bacteroidetes bacterium]|nr:lasso peptide biosynthesis PqqD family chaperone [Bacteroidota bacterium]
MALNLLSVISKNASIISSKMDDEVVMMNIEKGNYYGLNPVAAEIWEMLTEPMTVQAICDRLMEEFDVDQDTCQNEVIAYVEKLFNESLIVVNG